MLKSAFLFSFLSLILFACQFSNKENATHAKTNNYCSFCVDSSDFKPLTKKYIGKIRPEIEAYFNGIMDSLGFNGAFLVAKNGHVIYENYTGFSSLKNQKKIRSNTPLHLASVGKVLTATAIFRLIEMKKLHLDQKVKSILPEFPYPTITVRMLLNHRSGVPKYANFSEPDSIWGKEKILHNKDILKLLEKFKFPLDFEPNTKFVYNNSNYALLALILEKKTNLSFKEAMKELVFDPLGMRNTFVFILEEDKYRVSQSYSSRMQIQSFDNLDAVYGDKNIYSTPRDLLKYDMAMQKDDFISKALKKEIFKGYSYERSGIKNYGLGIRLKEWNKYQRIFYHNGWWHGNTSAYVTLKKEGVTLIAISNKYTRKVYDIIRLSTLFGDYPFEMEEEEEMEKNIDFSKYPDSLAK